MKLKKRTITILFVLLVSLFICTSFASADTIVDYQIYGTQDYQAAQEVLDQLNELRVSQGLPMLTLDPVLTQMAMQRASECAVYYDHVRPDGSAWSSIIHANPSYYYGSAGENIAAGYQNSQAVMTGWTNSPGHYANMVSTKYRSVGIGCFYQDDGTKYWAQLFHSNTATTSETKNNKVYRTDIPISAATSYFNLHLAGYNNCAINLYKGVTSEPRLYVTNPEWEYGSNIYISGGYSLRSNNTACATTSGKTITAVDWGSVTIDYVFNSIYVSIPYQILENPELWYYIDDYGNVVIVSEGYLDTSNNVQVYFKETNDEYWTLTNINNTNTTYTITNAEYGDAYTCVVRYYDDLSGKWVEVSERIVAKKALSTPKAYVSTVASTGKPLVTWNEVEGADKYEVYRATSKNGSYQKMFTTTNTSYTNTSAVAGKTYYYKVKAICSRNAVCNSNYSEIKTVTCDLASPQCSLTITTSSGKPKLTWDAVAKADKYEIYRATSKNGTYTKMYTTTSTSYTNTSAVAGNTYYYKVKAIYEDNSYANSAYSSVKYITCDLAQPVVSITTSSDSGKPKLTWSSVSGASKYEIYRANTKNGTYTKMYTTTSTSYTNTSAKAGYTYYYKVKAICSKTSYGNSAYSSIKSITCDLARPEVSISLNSSGKPKLTWGKVEGATKYEIYRSTSKNGTYTKIYTTEYTSFNNNGAKAGTTYYYKVKAIHGSNSYANSAYSYIVYKTAK